MERNRLIIIALLVVIIALLAGILITMPNFTKVDSKLEIIGNDTINEGDNLQIKLTDVNGVALANQTVKITFIDKDNSNSDYSLVTNDEGVGELKIDKSVGDYTVTVSYDGNNGYNGCDATKKITIEKKATESQKQVYAYKSDGTPMYSQEEVDNYVQSKYGAVNYHIQDNGYINIDDPGYTDDGARVVKGGVNKNGKTYERSFYENYIMGK